MSNLKKYPRQEDKFQALAPAPADVTRRRVFPPLEDAPVQLRRVFDLLDVQKDKPEPAKVEGFDENVEALEREPKEL